jgi:hypothetical protein
LNTNADQRRAAAYITALRDPAIDADLAAHGLAPTLLRLFGKGALAAMEPEERASCSPMAGWRGGTGHGQLVSRQPDCRARG